jgi:hypothetical protein
MRSQSKELTVEEKSDGRIAIRTVLFPVCTVLQWLDESGGFHQLMLRGSDVEWLIKMRVAIESRNG